MKRYLDPKADVVFKKVFGEHPHLLKSFLNAVLPLPDEHPIVSLEYLSAEHTPAIPALKKRLQMSSVQIILGGSLLLKCKFIGLIASSSVCCLNQVKRW